MPPPPRLRTDDWGGDPDAYAQIFTCDSGAGLTGWNGFCHEYAYAPQPDSSANALSGAMQRATMIPLTTSSLQVKLWDQDDWSADEEIGLVSVAPFASCGAASMAASGCAVNLYLQRQMCSGLGWWASCSDHVTATVVVRLRTGAAMETELAALNAAGTVVVEPKSALLDPDSIGAYWSSLTYYADVRRHRSQGSRPQR